MAKVSTFYSVNPGLIDVYHNDNKCSEGKRIPPGDKAPGEGGRRICKICASLK